MTDSVSHSNFLPLTHSINHSLNKFVLSAPSARLWQDMSLVLGELEVWSSIQNMYTGCDGTVGHSRLRRSTEVHEHGQEGLSEDMTPELRSEWEG